ncbi:helix-turn-helix domain-containing protein [Sarcina ventriculi]
MIKTKIKIYRKRKNLTQRQLAIKCNLTQGYISLLENNLESPTLRTLELIANALNVCILELIDLNSNIYCNKIKDKCCSYK